MMPVAQKILHTLKHTEYILTSQIGGKGMERNLITLWFLYSNSNS